MKFFKLSSFNFRMDHSILGFLKGLAVDLPAPVKISYWWGYGSLLGVFLGVQLLSGLFLAMQFMPDALLAFKAVDLIMRDMWGGWFVRSLHCNGASFYFLFLYFHMGRGMYYNSFYYHDMWYSGLVMFVLSMAIAFFGYVLPWGKMSYWGAAVMTNLFSVIPYFGKNFVFWLWGGFSVVSPTLTRFFVLHFILPFVVLGLVIIHVILLHKVGSNNPLGFNSKSDKMYFHPYYSSKDVFGFVLFGFIFFMICLKWPYMFLCSENFMEAKVLSTPEHIEPDWFLLMPYAILRSVPNKLGGVLSLVFVILFLFFLPFLSNLQFRGSSYKIYLQLFYWFWVVSILILCLMGASPVEDPFIIMGQIFGVIYFLYYFLVFLCS